MEGRRGLVKMIIYNAVSIASIRSFKNCQYGKTYQRSKFFFFTVLLLQIWIQIGDKTLKRFEFYTAIAILYSMNCITAMESYCSSQLVDQHRQDVYLTVVSEAGWCYEIRNLHYYGISVAELYYPKTKQSMHILLNATPMDTWSEEGMSLWLLWALHVLTE